MTQTFRWTFASHLSSNIQSYAAKRDIGDYIVLRSLLIPHGTHNHTHHVVHIHRWLIVTCPSTFCRRHRRRRSSSRQVTLIVTILIVMMIVLSQL